MKNRYFTLQTIYELVKNDAHPTTSVIYPNEIIVRQSYPWDEIVKYLNELKAENLIEILQHSPAIINLTEAGLQHMRVANSKLQDQKLIAA
ncbi:MAG TPA: hypothetical protein PLU37_07795 [Chitinophagaceae bacterium]|nr:hypothetical protein [Chitinophagaceae bacterium]